MISYHSEKNMFHLCNDEVSYYLYINELGIPETLYFGERLESIEHISALTKKGLGQEQYLDCQTGQEYLSQCEYRGEVSRVELSSHGYKDKRGTSILLEHGLKPTDFRYVSHEIYEGIRPLKTLPSADKNKDVQNVDTLVLRLEEKSSQVYVNISISIYRDKNILIKNYEIENRSSEDIRLTRAMSMQIDLPRAGYILHQYAGRWYQERYEEKVELQSGVHEVFSNVGRSSHHMNPFVFLAEKNADFDHGEVIGFNLIYSGNFKFRTYVDYYKNTHITYGMNDEDFEWTLTPGDIFETPQAVISYSNNGIDKMSQNFHRFIKDNLITYGRDREYKPVLFNSWEGCFFDFNTDSIIRYIEDAKKIGTELFVLDDGWFGARNHERAGLGDWFINESKLDLKKVIDTCHDYGMRFGLWFEPEMINPDSDLFRIHPEYVLGKMDKELTLQRHQLILDYTNPKVVDCIFKQMCNILDHFEIDYVKWDHNRDMAEHVSNFIPSERQGEVYHRMVLGYYDLLEKITTRYPNLMIEGCASGGGRFDMGTLYYCPQIWTSDDNDPTSRMNIQYTTSLGYPLSAMGAHVNDFKIGTYKAKSELAFWGTYGYEMNPNKLTEEEIAELDKTANAYKKYHADVIENGTLYHISSPFESRYLCMQSVSADQTKSAFLFMTKAKILQENRFFKLKGLQNEAKYKCSYDDLIYTGEYLMKIGLNLSELFVDAYTTELIFLERVKEM